MKKPICFATAIFLISGSLSTKAQSTSHKPLTALEINRIKVDSLDSNILVMLGERESLVKEIGMYKAKNHIPPLQASRFQEILKKTVAAGKQLQLSEDFVIELMNAIHKESLKIENTIKDNYK
jgi:chorismate mutase